MSFFGWLRVLSLMQLAIPAHSGPGPRTGKFGFLVESSWLAWQSPRTVRRSQSHPSSAQEVEEVAEAAAALFGISVEQPNLMIQQIWSA